VHAAVDVHRMGKPARAYHATCTARSATSDESHADDPKDMDHAEFADDVEVLTLSPGQYFQRRLAYGRVVVLLRRGVTGSRLRVRERQFREIDERRAQRQKS
jgi:hypothetical protein